MKKILFALALFSTGFAFAQKEDLAVFLGGTNQKVAKKIS